jgi:hypothetical protein
MTDQQLKQLTDAIQASGEEVSITIENVFGPIRDMYEMDFMNRWSALKKK